MLDKAYSTHSKSAAKPSHRSTQSVSQVEKMQASRPFQHMTLVDASQSRAFNYYRANLREMSPVKIDQENKFEVNLPN